MATVCQDNGARIWSQLYDCKIFELHNVGAQPSSLGTYVRQPLKFCLAHYSLILLWLLWLLLSLWASCGSLIL